MRLLVFQFVLRFVAPRSEQPECDTNIKNCSFVVILETIELNECRQSVVSVLYCDFLYIIDYNHHVSKNEMFLYYKHLLFRQ